MSFAGLTELRLCECSAYDCSVPARGKAVVKTDIAIAIPPGTYARIAPRSGLAVKHFIDTGKQQPLVLICLLQTGRGHAPCISLRGISLQQQQRI